LLYFLNDKGKENTYIHIVFITFVIIFKFILIWVKYVFGPYILPSFDK